MIELYWPQAIAAVWILQAAIFQSIDLIRALRRARRRRARTLRRRATSTVQIA